MRAPKPERLKFLEAAEIRALLECPRAAGMQRDYYLLSIAYYLALRGAEAVCMRTELIDLKGNEAHIPSVKRKAKKNEHLDSLTNRPLLPIPILFGDDVLLGAIRWASSSGSPWMFPSRFNDKEPISTRQFRLTFRYWAKKAGLDHRVSAHSLRHSAGSHVYEVAGAKIRAGGQDPLILIRDFMRHADIKTTSIYLHTSRPTIAAARKAMRG